MVSVVLVVVPVLVLQCWCRGVVGATSVDVGIGVNSCFRWGNRGALGFGVAGALGVAAADYIAEELLHTIPGPAAG